MIRQLYHLIIIQFKEYFREPGVIFWAFLFPVIMAWVLGIAFDSKAEIKRSIGVVTESRSEFEIFKKISSAKGGSFASAGIRYDFEFSHMSEAEAVSALKKGKIALYLAFNGRKKNVVYHFDSKNSEAFESYLVLEKFINGEYRSGIINIVNPITARGSRYIDFFIPGLIAMQIMNACLWGIGWTLIELRMKKLMRRMYATPMSRSLFMISYFISRALLSVFETALIFLFAYFYFGMTISGSLTALVVLLFSGNAVFTGIALLTASRTSSSRIGNGLINAVTLPMTVLSGIFFSYHNFPEWTEPLISSLPLTMLADSLRSVFVENAGLGDVWIAASLMTAAGVVFSAISLRIFKWY